MLKLSTDHYNDSQKQQLEHLISQCNRYYADIRDYAVAILNELAERNIPVVKKNNGWPLFGAGRWDYPSLDIQVSGDPENCSYKDEYITLHPEKIGFSGTRLQHIEICYEEYRWFRDEGKYVNIIDRLPKAFLDMLEAIGYLDRSETPIDKEAEKKIIEEGLKYSDNCIKNYHEMISGNFWVVCDLAKRLKEYLNVKYGKQFFINCRFDGCFIAHTNPEVPYCPDRELQQPWLIHLNTNMQTGKLEGGSVQIGDPGESNWINEHLDLESPYFPMEEGDDIDPFSLTTKSYENQILGVFDDIVKVLDKYTLE